MNLKTIITIALMGISISSFGTSPTVEGNEVFIDPSELMKSYTIEEGDSFGFYIGLPASLPYKVDFEYNTNIIEADNKLDLNIGENTISGVAPNVDGTTIFKFKTETETDLDKPHDFIIREFEIIVLNK